MITPPFTLCFLVVASMARKQHQIVLNLTHCHWPMTHSYGTKLLEGSVVSTTWCSAPWSPGGRTDIQLHHDVFSDLWLGLCYLAHFRQVGE